MSVKIFHFPARPNTPALNRSWLENGEREVGVFSCGRFWQFFKNNFHQNIPQKPLISVFKKVKLFGLKSFGFSDLGVFHDKFEVFAESKQED